MNHLKKYAPVVSLPRRKTGLPNRVLAIETLSKREMMTGATVVLDFNGATETDIENANVLLNGDFGERETLTGFQTAFETLDDSFLDFDQNGQVDLVDSELAIERIMARVQEDVSPFDISVSRNDITVGQAGGITALRGSTGNYDGLLFVTGDDMTDADFWLSTTSDSMGYVSGSVGWAEMIAGRTDPASEKTDRFVNVIANNISQQIGVSVGVSITSDAIGLMGDSVTGLTENGAFSKTSFEIVTEQVGRSQKPYTVVLEPGILTIQGSAEADRVNLIQHESNEIQWTVEMEGRPSAYVDSSASPDHNSLNWHSVAIERIEFHGGDGDDVFTVSPSLMVPVFAHGGAGNDYLVGGGANDWISGQDGDDTVNGMGGNDRVRGDAGVDVIIGGNPATPNTSLVDFPNGDFVLGREYRGMTFGVGGWRVDRHPRFLADVDGDGRDDLVGFSHSGVSVGLSNGHDFQSPTQWVADYGYNEGWRADLHPRLLADVNGDGKDDIIGFANSGVQLSFSTGEGFSPQAAVIAGFGQERGSWRTAKHIRTTADVNGDGLADIVGIGGAQVLVAFSNGEGFDAPQGVVTGYGYDQGWRLERHERILADVNGDGMDDLVAFGENATYVSLSLGDGFDDSIIWEDDFSYQDGWRVEKHIRQVVDVNNDGMADVVGFFDDGIYVSLSTGDGFSNAEKWSDDFGYDSGWLVDTNSAAYYRDDVDPRYVTDVNGDGYLDILGYGATGVWVSISDGQRFGPSQEVTSGFGRENGGWVNTLYPRQVADVNGDGKADIVGFGWDGVVLMAAITESVSSPQVPGDFDGNALLDAADIDLLSAAIRGDDSDSQFDLNQDGSIDQADRSVWIRELAETSSGDANLDQRFDSTDLVQIFQRGQYEDGVTGNSGWADGDWTGDGEFDTADLVAAFQAGTYEAAAATAETMRFDTNLAAAVDHIFGDSQAKRRN